MPGDLIQQKKTQKNLLLILLIVFVITIFVIYQGFFGPGEEPAPEGAIFIQKPEVKISFDVLQGPVFEKLQSFSEIEPFEESTTTESFIGRDNPFLPY